MIDLSIRECSGNHGHGQDAPPRLKDSYQARLKALIDERAPAEIPGKAALPKPVRIGVEQSILGLFPENRFIMLTNKKNFHPIQLRDVWLSGRYNGKPSLSSCSFISSNYCSRDDADGTSFDAFEGIARRWMIVEDDHITLEQQFWIHRELAKRHGNLGCVCYSGGKSLHGWYFVEGWTSKQCFELYGRGNRLRNSRFQRVGHMPASSVARRRQPHNRQEAKHTVMESLTSLARGRPARAL